MDKEVKNILRKYFRGGVNFDDLQSELFKANCIIYQSELPPINGQAIQHVDATPNKDYPLRILRAYRQDCDCLQTENMDSGEVINPLLKAMNANNGKRAKLLDKAIAILSRNAICEKDM